MKVYFWLTANCCECSHPERFSRERSRHLHPISSRCQKLSKASPVLWCYIVVVWIRIFQVITFLWKPTGRGNVRGLTPKSEKEENSEDEKSIAEETRCSLGASDKGSYQQEWPADPSNHEQSIGASRQNIHRAEERGFMNVWPDFNRGSDSESPDDCDESFRYQIILCERKLCWNVQHPLSLQFDGIHWSTLVWSFWDSRATQNKQANMNTVYNTQLFNNLISGTLPAPA